MSLEQDFSALPAELQDGIMLFITQHNNNSENKYDIEVSIDDNAELHCSALEFVEKLRNDGSTILNDVSDYLFGSEDSRFRFVIKNSTWPLNEILRRFQHRLKSEGREGVTKLAIERYTLHGIDLGDSVDIAAETPNGAIPTKRITSPYLLYLERERGITFDRDGLNLFKVIRDDLNRATNKLLKRFPNLKHLELGIDIVDCFITDRNLDRGLRGAVEAYDKRGWLRKENNSIFDFLAGLYMKDNLSSLDITIHWGDFFRRGRVIDLDIPDQEIRKYEDDFLQKLKEKVPAKSITPDHN